MANSDNLLPQIEPYLGRANDVWFDIAMIVGGALVIGLLFLIVFRIMRVRKDGTIVHSRRSEAAGSPGGGGFLGMGSGKRHRKRRNRGPSYAQRNPTRAEVGGMPPVRSPEDSAGGASDQSGLHF
ncbi:MAG: hypothetical protein HY301_09365 [Verrucomicrobia bacterium]|nr:hypothetical protein [Verrucomicrobiota bacterium]